MLGGEFWFTKKEKHYFDRDETYAKGTNWYLSHFPKCAEGAPVVTVDATQAYSKVPSVPPRMLEMYGDQANRVVFVMMLRDPVQRLFSNYFHRKACCLGDISFEKWAETQIQQSDGCAANGTSLWPGCGEEGLFAGFYGLQLSTWIESFCPSQFSLVSFSGFIRDPAYTISRVAGRVGIHNIKGIPKNVEFASKPAIQVKRKNAKTPGDQTMMATTRKRLEAWYDSHNQELLNVIEQNPGFDLVPHMEQIRKDFSYADTGAEV